MSTTAPKTFLVYAPDYSDAASRRAKVRPKHIEDANKRRETGVTVIGGAILDGSGNMVGSMFVVRAESEKEVRDIVEGDVYWKGDVWDKSKLVVAPFRINGPPTAKL